jgi:hypothetical protein
MVIWLSDRSDAATSFAKRSLLMRDGTGTPSTARPRPARAPGCNGCTGDDAARFCGVARGDARLPDLFGVAQYGTVYTGSKGKIAEHGGAGAQDTSVPLVDAGSASGTPGSRAARSGRPRSPRRSSVCSGSTPTHCRR